MKLSIRSRLRGAFLVAALTAVSACNSDKTIAPPVLKAIAVTITANSVVPGQTTTVAASGTDAAGASFATGQVLWSTSAPTVAVVSQTGVVTAIAPGTAVITAAVGSVNGNQTVTVNANPAITINEVESNGGTPGDWVELYNPTTTAVDISNWGFRDNDTTHTIYKIPAGTTIAAGGYYLLEEAQFGFGLGAADDARLYNAFNTTVEVYSWTAHAATTYGRCAGQTGLITTTISTKGAANDCSLPLRINEVESSGGTPGDWIELYNFGSSPISIGGYTLLDNDDTHIPYAIPAGTTIAAGGYYVADEASFVFGLGAADAVRLFSPTGTLVESYSWTTHAVVTYGRCPDGTGAFTSTSASTKGTANTCGGITPAPTTTPWPGLDDVVTIDGTSVFTQNLSGLMYEPAAGGTPAVLWGARNGPGSIFRLIFDGTIWTPDPTNGWSAGKLVKYPDGTGEPDTEDITYTTGSSAGLYTVAERNNSANTVSRNSILRYDPAGTATTMVATNEWNITADIPATGANLGLEGITWIPDAFLVSKGFIDESVSRAYNPTDYPNHGSGIFFVGVEASGIIYAYALNHTTNTFTKLATFSTGFPAGVMALNFDRDLNYLWAVCDDGCGGLLATFEINTTPAAANIGKFGVTRLFARPTSMPNLNNEGFTVTRQADCINGRKFVYWADDGETGGHSIRRASISCTAFP